MTAGAYTGGMDRSPNAAALAYRALVRRGALSNQDLSLTLGLSPSRVSQLLHELGELRLLVEHPAGSEPPHHADTEDGAHHRRKLGFTLDGRRAWVLTADATGLMLHVTWVSLDLEPAPGGIAAPLPGSAADPAGFRAVRDAVASILGRAPGEAVAVAAVLPPPGGRTPDWNAAFSAACAEAARSAGLPCHGVGETEALVRHAHCAGPARDGADCAVVGLRSWPGCGFHLGGSHILPRTGGFALADFAAAGDSDASLGALLGRRQLAERLEAAGAGGAGLGLWRQLSQARTDPAVAAGVAAIAERSAQAAARTAFGLLCALPVDRVCLYADLAGALPEFEAAVKSECRRLAGERWQENLVAFGDCGPAAVAAGAAAAGFEAWLGAPVQYSKL